MKYTGSKNAHGLYQFLINNIPFHKEYFELYAGSASLFYKKKAAMCSFLTDLNNEVLQYHFEKNQSDQSVNVQRIDAISALKNWDFNKDSFIYLDPPYPFESRRNGKKYYQYEMSDDDHVSLLSTITAMDDTSIMISTRQNRLYDTMLKHWRKEKFHTSDRAGSVYEIIYMNYDQPKFLHQYDYLGFNCTDRQRINRKIKRFGNKLNELPKYEKHLFIMELLKQDISEVKHFLAMLPGNID